MQNHPNFKVLTLIRTHWADVLTGTWWFRLHRVLCWMLQGSKWAIRSEEIQNRQSYERERYESEHYLQWQTRGRSVLRAFSSMFSWIQASLVGVLVCTPCRNRGAWLRYSDREKLLWTQEPCEQDDTSQLEDSNSTVLIFIATETKKNEVV